LPSNDSAAKRHRQNLKNRLRNRSYKSELRTKTKSFLATVSEGKKEAAESQYRDLTAMLDKAVNKGILHSNTASRQKSRLHRVMTRE
jgi:small subunit ribosomal protein S20